MEAKALVAESSVETSPTKDEALKNAIRAVELYMKAAELAGNSDEKARLRSKCNELLSRAEEIKKSARWPPRRKTIVPKSRRTISKREEVILLEGSRLHGFIFPPWTSEPDDENFTERSKSDKYTEPADLKLSDAQKEIFDDWNRPFADVHRDELLMNPMKAIDLVQDITTDCSVVASLCAGTARESKGHETLFASVIHPFDESKLRPKISKSGKYIFRFHFNGCFRQVTVDDRLPASRTTRSLHVIDRNNPQLIWPALVEKAYLKVRGGYDFPGSNSGTDLWVITGWIPEQVFLQSDDVPPEQLWNRIYKSFGYGDVIITLGTGRLSHKEEKELGLAGEHDYAILDMKEVGSQRIMLVKNPWCDGMIWKGSQAPTQDFATATWTKDIRDVLPSSSPISPGSFWMTFEDIIQHFESLYLNWNPGLFLYRQDHHFSWTIPAMKSHGSFTHNPQYVLKSTRSGTVWVSLSRHFATKENDIVKTKPKTAFSASSVLGFISLYIFDANGQKVYLSDNAFHRGAYVDSPQTLARLEVAPSASYTIVVAQQGLPLPKYSFTLSFFSRTQISVDKAEDSLPHCTTHAGAWTLRTAGGNASSPHYPSNPQFSISIPSPTDITLILETDQEELAVHVKLVWADGQRVTAVTSKDIVGGSGDYRRGCALASIQNVAAGNYTIVCSTFEAGQTGNFTLRVGSKVPCVVKPVMAETAGRLRLQLPPLIFQDGVNRMLAPLTTSRMMKLRIVAKCSGTGRFAQSSRSRPSLKVSLERGQGPNKTTLHVSGGGGFSDSPMGTRTADLDLSPGMSQPGGLWIVLERLGGSNGPDEVTVEVLSDSPVTVGIWGTGDG